MFLRSSSSTRRLTRCASERDGTTLVRELTIGQARRIALAAQGFNDPRPRGRVDMRHLRRVLGRVGLFQVDSVNVLVRAHYMPLFSRLGPYPRELLDKATYRRGRRRCEFFETWAHEASIMPAERWPLVRRCLYEGSAWYDRWARKNSGYIDGVLEEIRQKGALTASELEDPGERSGAWWSGGKGSTALGWHFHRGNLGIAQRPNFTRVYDLPERILPSAICSESGPTLEEAFRALLLLGAESHGVGTAKDLADYYRLPILPSRKIVAELAEAGELEEVRVEGWKDPAYIHASAVLPRRINARVLLSPFDPVVWERDRTQRLFDFHYRIEIYVPAPKRKYGYYVLPFLLGDQLVGRVDLKADREASRLLVQAAYHEEGADADEVADSLSEELASMADWLGLADVQVKRRGNLSGALRVSIGRRA